MMTVEQRRAADAMARVSELSNQSDGFKKRYRAYVDRLCPTIVMNGLGQALATERAAAGSRAEKEDDEWAHEELYIGLQCWLCREGEGIYPTGQDLLDAIMSHDESLYLCAQAEALAWLNWHKKFCRATFPKGEEE
jgi:CRISPR-associated protein Cmr5